MTARVERTFEFSAPGERVWEFIADPAKRTGAISVVDRSDISDDGRHATRYFELPIPLVRLTATAETEDTEVDEPTHIKFVDKSQVIRVMSKHTIEKYDGGSRPANEFTVDGRLPGIETSFERNLDRELDNLETEPRREFEATA